MMLWMGWKRLTIALELFAPLGMCGAMSLLLPSRTATVLQKGVGRVRRTAKRRGHQPDAVGANAELPPQPRWWALYALGIVGGFLVLAGDALFRTAAWRGVWEAAAACAILGSMGLWVRANRIALAKQSGAASPAEESEDTIDLQLPPPAIPERAA